jgi:hypothetical protein
MIPENLEYLRGALARANPAKPAPILVAACKQQDENKLREAIKGGVTDFGENRVREAREKWPLLKQAHPRIRLHLIGSLQTNKVAEAVALFDVIETVDREKLAEQLAKEMEKQNRWPECFVQVNTGEEEQKGGVLPQDADALIARCKELKLPVTGLMCVPPADVPPAPHFALLREIAKRHGLQNLSMGMSGDFETAIKFGATHVRIGTALFGERR